MKNDRLHVILLRQHKLASKGDLYLLIKNNVFNVDRVREIVGADARCHTC